MAACEETYGFFPCSTSLGGSTTVLAPLIDVQNWWSLQGKASYIYAKAKDGVSDDDLKANVRAALQGRRVA
jgi:hypothetical protein